MSDLGFMAFQQNGYFVAKKEKEDGEMLKVNVSTFIFPPLLKGG